MKMFEVNCISKLTRDGPHEQITHIGNSTKQWRLTRKVAITRILSSAEAFYILDKSSGKRSYIGVFREARKPPYLRAYADGKWNDDLLAQPECGTSCKVISA